MEIDEKSEQRVIIKFLVKLGKNSLEINKMLNAVYGDYALKNTCRLNVSTGAVKVAKVMQSHDAL